jgi:RNA 2',3'-cyclic 3'-phosphodiesterase
MRTFIAIDIPEKIKKEIIKIQNSLPEFKGKKTEHENIHLTLKFLGEIDEEKNEEIKKRLNEIKLKNFEAEIKNLGFFDNRKSYKKQLIIWLYITGCDELQKIVDGKLSGLFEKERRFMSHLTIARVKRIRNEQRFFNELLKIKIPEMKFEVKNFKLKKSKLTRNGPVYEDIEVFNLEI